MKSIYLVRHGEAKSKMEDPQRGLTTRGQQSVARLAKWAGDLHLPVDEIRHSGILRAEQTARILAAAFPSAGEPVRMPGLEPDDAVRPIAESLAAERRSVMLVGHLPLLSCLASQLVVRDPRLPLVWLEPATLLRLSEDDFGWTIDCLVRPAWLA